MLHHVVLGMEARRQVHEVEMRASGLRLSGAGVIHRQTEHLGQHTEVIFNGGVGSWGI